MVQTKKADWPENIFLFLLKQAISRTGGMSLKERKKSQEGPGQEGRKAQARKAQTRRAKKARKGREESLDKAENSEKVPRNTTLMKLVFEEHVA